MRISVPSMGDRGLDEEVGQHFGRVPSYTIVDTETDEVRVVPNTSEHGGGSGYPPEIMAREGVDIMLCGGLGRRAVSMFEQLGIRVFVGVQGTVRDAVRQYQEGRLEEATDENACREHAFHDRHQGH